MLRVLNCRADYVHFVEVLYFGALQAGQPEQVLAWFAPGAILTGYAGDAPPRIMSRSPKPGQSSLDDFMHGAARFDLAYSDFVHHVDIEQASVASCFTLMVSPKAGGAARRMKNCSFFQFQNNRLSGVIAYFSNPP